MSVLRKNSGLTQSAIHLPKIHGQKSQSHTNLDDKTYELHHSIRLKTDFDQYEHLRFETIDTLTPATNMNGASPNFLTQSYANTTKNYRGSMQDSPQTTKKMYNSSFKSNGARFSLNCSVNNSPKIFMRQIKGGIDSKNSSIMSDRSQFHYTRIRNSYVDRYGRTKEQIDEEKSRENELQSLKKLNESDEIALEDKKSKEIIGEEAVESYYGHYKNLSKIVQQNSYYQVQRKIIQFVISHTNIKYQQQLCYYLLF